MEAELKHPVLRKDLSTVFRQGLALLLMLVVAGLLDYLPGADLQLFGRMPISLLLRFIIALGMAGVLLLVYRHTSRLMRHAVLAAFVHGPSTPPLDAAAARVAKHATLLIYVCLLYAIVMRGSEPLIVILTAAPWPFTLIRLCSLVVVVIALIGLFAGAPPLLQEAGDTLAGQVTSPGDPIAGQLKCPGCGVLDDGASKYCRFCGRLLAEEPAAVAAPAPVTCTRCGAAVRQPARFCADCGKPV